jgi:hypothetical protein
MATWSVYLTAKGRACANMELVDVSLDASLAFEQALFFIIAESHRSN